MALMLLSPCLAVTAAPGKGKPPNFAVPWCSDPSSGKTAGARASNATTNVYLVFRGFLDTIDHNIFDRTFLRIQPQSKLLLQCGKDRRTARSRSGRSNTIPEALRARVRSDVRRPFEDEVILSDKSSLIDNRASRNA